MTLLILALERASGLGMGLLILLTCAHGGWAESWKTAEPGYRWEFPRDHGAHPDYRNEWWYFTGQIQTEENPPRRFGYQFTLFRVGISTAPAGAGSAWQSGQILMGHAALSDIQTGKHYFHDTLVRESPLLGRCVQAPPASSPICWMAPPTGVEGNWEVSWNGKGFQFKATTADFSFDLLTQPEKPLIFQGPDGVSRKTSDGSSASLYYSFTRLKTSGTISISSSPKNGLRSLPVTGLSWMDKEFGSGTIGANQVGWDWFSLQLTDGRDLMLYLLRKKDGTVDHAHGTLVDQTGGVRYLTDFDFKVAVTLRWKKPETGTVYPAGWTVTSPFFAPLKTIHVTPLVADSENRGTRVPGLNYWEGAVRLQDDLNNPIGQGYVELTGYAGSIQDLQIR